jgi:hypothetical protein
MDFMKAAALLWLNPLFKSFVFYLVDQPLFNLYLNGPALGGYGFWEGKERAQMCAELTGVPEREWLNASDACESLIMRKFNALVVGIHFLSYLIVCSCLCCKTWSLCSFVVCGLCRRHKTAECYHCSMIKSCGELRQRLQSGENHQ